MQAKGAVAVLAMAWLLAAGVGLASPDQEFFGVVKARPGLRPPLNLLKG
ncbi:MAG: hypothetical protein WHT07_06760 [Desulfobaccales bacterium]